MAVTRGGDTFARAAGTAPVCSPTYSSAAHPEAACRRLRSLLDCAGMSDPHLTRIGRLTTLCLLVAAVVMIGLAIVGAFKGGPSPLPELASQK